FRQVTKDLPDIRKIEDYTPEAVSEVYSRDGVLIGEFLEKRRYPVKLSEVPLFVRNAFLAAEDAAFYSHPGINIVGILRALIVNLKQGKIKQGGSTITQQVVKNLLLSSEQTIRRKVREAVLAYQLERRLSKDEIFEIYLNQIYFGSGAYGLKAASRIYFRKEPQDLTLAEAAMLAGLPKAPSAYSPVKHFKRAKERQLYVLRRMVKAGFITKEAARAAKRQQLKIYGRPKTNFYTAPYFLSEVEKQFKVKWPQLDPKRDGLKIITTMDTKAQSAAVKALRWGLEDVSKRRGWRGPINYFPVDAVDNYEVLYGQFIPEKLEENKFYPALVLSVSKKNGITLKIGEKMGWMPLNSIKWAKKRLVKGKFNLDEHTEWTPLRAVLRRGDVVTVKVKQEEKKDGIYRVELSQEPEVEGALVLINPFSGEVWAMVGGYSWERSKFNRATQAFRQPGSAFKPIVYLTAIDKFNYTPATIVYDSPRAFRVGDDYWIPNNFDKKFLGPITLQLALERSRNLVSADIISRIGVDSVIEYARKLGIKSPLGRNLSLSLGSSELTLLELTRAYGVFPAQGMLFPTIYINKILDRNGEVIYSADEERIKEAKQVVDPKSAFIMVNMMRGVVERGTGWRVRALKRPAAGKTGTSNDLMDAWFIGYTPEWVCGVWVGFDVKKTIGEHETGGRAAAPIWLKFMQNFLKQQEQKKYQELLKEAKEESELLGVSYTLPQEVKPADFTPPEGLETAWINRFTGELSSPDDVNTVKEYFLPGTVPSAESTQEEKESYFEDAYL
ncbi:MAG: PBP1A family penicillin-binding protein, partial [Candidatus Dadabacteria bacterium]